MEGGKKRGEGNKPEETLHITEQSEGGGRWVWDGLDG